MKEESAILQLDRALLRAQTDYEEINRILRPFEGERGVLAPINENLIFHGDNLELLTELRGREKFSMIYIDPPFFTGADKEANMMRDGELVRETAYKDNWSTLEEYLHAMALRIMLMRDVLRDDGLFFIHVDWHAVHYARLLMDEIFGQDRFINEIIWQYKSGGSSKTRFARKHDNILMYSKTRKYKFFIQKEKSYNRGLKPYRFKGVEEFQDEIGWYTMVNMKDVWSIDMVGRTSSERTGYATQKPEKLMERIIECSTEEGDLVGDFFCGSGSLGVSAAKLGRRFVMADTGNLAMEVTKKRLGEAGIEYTVRGRE
ncbi:MAG: site-specific DNA-methyltransferase [Firmicutes bacterium]|nr:site-specific DNA-methyltransferase [Bacillota bacterium]